MCIKLAQETQGVKTYFLAFQGKAANVVVQILGTATARDRRIFLCSLKMKISKKI
jgi:hypothetical protein